MEAYRLKLKKLEELRIESDQLRAKGKRIVFTNGCFDLLHPGHTRYLWAARELGNFLIVALNSDKSVRAIKGEGRPVYGQEERAELLAALGCVDAVVIFNEEDPLHVIEQLQPDVLVKGGDWKEDEIIGASMVKGRGGEVRRIPFVSGYSTTRLIEQIRKRRGP